MVSKWQQIVLVYFSFLRLSNSSLFAGSEFSFSMHLLVLSVLAIFNLTEENGMYSLRQREKMYGLKQYLKVFVKGFPVSLMNLKYPTIKLN